MHLADVEVLASLGATRRGTPAVPSGARGQAGRLMTGWRRSNTVTGHLVFALPAVLAAPALAATISRFGVWVGVTSALLPMLVVAAPWLVWLRYTRRRPRTRRALLAWSAVAGGVVVMLLASPLWLWAGPVLAVVLSETVRTVTERIRQNQRPLSASGAGPEEQRTR